MQVYYKIQECGYMEEALQMFAFNLSAEDPTTHEYHLYPALGVLGGLNVINMFTSPSFKTMDDVNSFIKKHVPNTLIDLEGLDLTSVVSFEQFQEMRKIGFQQTHPEEAAAQGVVDTEMVTEPTKEVEA